MFRSKSNVSTEKFYNVLRKIQGTFSHNDLMKKIPELNESQIWYRLNRLIFEGYVEKASNNWTNKQYKVIDHNRSYTPILERKKYPKKNHASASKILKDYKALVRVQEKPYNQYSLSSKVYETIRAFTNAGIAVKSAFVVRYFHTVDNIPGYKISVQISKFLGDNSFKKDNDDGIYATYPDTPYYLPKIEYNYRYRNAWIIHQTLAKKQNQGGASIQDVINSCKPIQYFTARKILDTMQERGFAYHEGNTLHCRYYVTDKSKEDFDKEYHGIEIIDWSNPVKNVIYQNNFEQIFKPMIKTYQNNPEFGRKKTKAELAKEAKEKNQKEISSK